MTLQAVSLQGKAARDTYAAQRARMRAFHEALLPVDKQALLEEWSQGVSLPSLDQEAVAKLAMLNEYARRARLEGQSRPPSPPGKPPRAGPGK